MPLKTFINGVFKSVETVKAGTSNVAHVKTFYGGLWKNVWNKEVLTTVPYSEGWYQIDIYPHGRDPNNISVHNACSDESIVLNGTPAVVVSDVGWANTLTPTPTSLSILETYSQLFTEKYPPIPMYTVYNGVRYSTNGEHYESTTEYFPYGGEMYTQKYNLSIVNVSTPT